MSDQISAGRPEKQVLSKVVLLERIRHYRGILEETIAGLDDQRMSQPGREQWAIKDHLVHLAVWEQGMVALLGRRPRFTAMGVEKAFEQGQSETEINDLIFQQNKELGVSQALAKFAQAHLEMMELLEALDEADLHRPYSDYVAGGDEQRQEPVIFWVIGNTYAHFDEHTAYIRRLLEDD